MHDILHFAMEREQDSIMFYMGVKEAIPKNRGRDEMATIIYEEMTRLALLDMEVRRL